MAHLHCECRYVFLGCSSVRNASRILYIETMSTQYGCAYVWLSPFRTNRFSISGHWYGFASQRIMKLMLSLALSLKRLPHSVHSKTVSLFRIRKLLVRYSIWLILSKYYTHTEHLYCFSQLWMRKCLFRVSFIVKLLHYSVHWSGFFPVWMRRCRVRRAWS